MVVEAAPPTRSGSGRRAHARGDKSPSAFRTISEVADEINVPQHVLRFWETKFTQVRPLKRAGGRRYYRPEDVALLGRIRVLLYDEGYTIKGVQKLLRNGGVKAGRAAARAAPPPRSAGAKASLGRKLDAAGAIAELRELRGELVNLRDMLRAARRRGD